MAEEGVEEPLRFTAALSDGRSIYAVRHASDQAPPSLYWRAACGGAAVSIVSEPLEQPETWQSIPTDRVLVVGPDLVVSFAHLGFLPHDAAYPGKSLIFRPTAAMRQAAEGIPGIPLPFPNRKTA